MTARNLPIALVFLALGFALGCLFTSSGGREPPKNGERVALEAIDARLVRIEAALGRERADTSAQPVAPAAGLIPPPAAAPSTSERIPVATPADESAVAAELAALRTAIESLRPSEPGRGVPARFPTLAMLRAAPEPNRGELERLHPLLCAGGRAYEEANASLHWKSQDEILATFGKPSEVLKSGMWEYNLDGDRSLEFGFVEDYVVNANAMGCP